MCSPFGRMPISHSWWLSEHVHVCWKDLMTCLSWKGSEIPCARTLDWLLSHSCWIPCFYFRVVSFSSCPKAAHLLFLLLITGFNDCSLPLPPYELPTFFEGSPRGRHGLLVAFLCPFYCTWMVVNVMESAASARYTIHFMGVYTYHSGRFGHKPFLIVGALSQVCRGGRVWMRGCINRNI